MSTSPVKTLTLKNIRCYQNSTIEIGPVTHICGDNESGKSSLVKALHAALFGSVQTELGGITKDKGLLVETLVNDPSQNALIKAVHEDGTVSKWQAVAKGDGKMSITHDPSPAAPQVSMLKEADAILRAGTPSARKGARKRFVELFDTGMSQADLLAAVPADCRKAIEDASEDLGLSDGERLEGVIAAITGLVKEAEKNIPKDFDPAVSTSAESDLNAIKDNIKSLREELAELQEDQKALVRKGVVDGMGDLDDIKSQHAKAKSVLEAALKTRDALHEERRAALAKVGITQVLIDGANLARAVVSETHEHDGICPACGADSTIEHFQGVIEDIDKLRVKSQEMSANFDSRIERADNTIMALNREVTALQEKVDLIIKAKSSIEVPDGVTLEDVEADIKDVNDEIATLIAEESAKRAQAEQVQRVSVYVVRKAAYQKALDKLVEYRDTRFKKLVDGFCADVSKSMPRGFGFEIEHANGDFMPYLVRDGRRVYDPTGAQADILRTAIYGGMKSDTVVLFDERDFDKKHLYWALRSAADREGGSQYIFQCTQSLPASKVEELSDKGVVFIEVDKIEGRA